MVLLGEEAQVEAWFGLVGHRGNLGACWMQGLHGAYHMLRNQFGRTRWNYLMLCVTWSLASVRLMTVLGLVPDRCMVCASCSLHSQTVAEAPDGNPGRRGSSGSLVRSIWR
jgi:hypothetical protein